MNKPKLLFSTALTDGSRFRKYQYFYGFLVFLLSGLVAFIYIDSEGENFDLVKIITHPFNIGVLILALFSLFLYVFINRRTVTGSLDVYEDKIIVQNKGLEIFRFNEIAHFEIQRGSTYHYAYQANNEIVKVSNYVRFEQGNLKKSFEFLIDSPGKNHEFETMIQTLQKNRIKVYYTSI